MKTQRIYFTSYPIACTVLDDHARGFDPSGIEVEIKETCKIGLVEGSFGRVGQVPTPKDIHHGDDERTTAYRAAHIRIIIQGSAFPCFFSPSSKGPSLPNVYLLGVCIVFNLLTASAPTPRNSKRSVPCLSASTWWNRFKAAWQSSIISSSPTQSLLFVHSTSAKSRLVAFGCLIRAAAARRRRKMESTSNANIISAEKAAHCQ